MKRALPTIDWLDSDDDELVAYMARLGLKRTSTAVRRLLKIGLNRHKALATYASSSKGKAARRRAGRR